jgi:hypothetical protein
MDDDRHRTTTEDDVTEPDDLPIEVPDADRAEQEALVDPPAVVSAADADPPPEDVPEADAIEQQLDALPRWVVDPRRPTFSSRSPACGWTVTSSGTRAASRTSSAAGDRRRPLPCR